MQKWVESEEELRAGLRLHEKLVVEFPKLAQYRYTLGDCRKSLGILLYSLKKWDPAEAEFREARETFKQLVDAAPDDPVYRSSLAQTHYNLGIVLYEKRRPIQAEKECSAAIDIRKKLVAQFPSVPRYVHALAAGYARLGMALTMQGKWDDAIAAYREGIRLEPDNANAHINLGAILCDHKGDYPGAATVFREAIRLDPKSAEAHVNLGNALDALGKVEGAIAAWEQANRLQPDIASNLVAGQQRGSSFPGPGRGGSPGEKGHHDPPE